MRPQCLFVKTLGIPHQGAGAAVFASTTCRRPEPKDTTSPILPVNFRFRLEIGLEIKSMGLSHEA